MYMAGVRPPGDKTGLRSEPLQLQLPGNELADRLADVGRGGGGLTLSYATTWLRDWLVRRGYPP